MIERNLPPPRPAINVKAPSLADALETDQSKVKKIFRKYGKESPYHKKPLPSVQWEGDNES